MQVGHRKHRQRQQIQTTKQSVYRTRFWYSGMLQGKVLAGKNYQWEDIQRYNTTDGTNAASKTPRPNRAIRRVLRSLATDYARHTIIKSDMRPHDCIPSMWSINPIEWLSIQSMLEDYDTWRARSTAPDTKSDQRYVSKQAIQGPWHCAGTDIWYEENCNQPVKEDTCRVPSEHVLWQSLKACIPQV